MTKNIGKPCTGKPYARFDEGALRRGGVTPEHVVAACSEASCKGPATIARISALLYSFLTLVLLSFFERPCAHFTAAHVAGDQYAVGRAGRVRQGEGRRLCVLAKQAFTASEYDGIN